jgi:hypothetical protein
MFSKRLAPAGVALVAAVLALGCGPKRFPGSTAMSLGVSASASRYLQGEADEAETASIFDCAIHSLTLFEQRTQGQTPGGYTPQELRAFLERYFLDGIKISDGLLTEVMELKRTVIGGSSAQFTTGDLTATTELFGKLKEQALRLRTYMPVTPGSLTRRSSWEVEQAAAAIHDAAGAIGDVLADTGNAYTFSHLQALMHELKGFKGIAGGGAGDVFSYVEDNIGLISTCKSTLFMPLAEGIGSAEWAPTLKAAADWYALYLRFELLERDYDSWVLGAGRERLVDLVREAFRLIDLSVSRRPGQVLTFDDMNRLIEAVFPHGITVMGDRTLSVEHTEAFLRPLVQRVFGGSDFGATGRKAPGLTREALERMRLHFEHWNDGQRYLEATYAAANDTLGGTSTQGYLPDQLQAFTLEKLLSLGWPLGPEAAAGDDGEAPPALLSDAVRRLGLVEQRDRALFPGASTQIYFNGYGTDRHLSLHDLSEANWMYSLARLMTAGYAEDPARAATDDDETQKVTFEEFKRFVDDIHDGGVDLKYIDPKDPHLAEKRYREAELFTFAGVGDEYVSTRQTAQLLALMISGQRLADRIYDGALAAKCKTYGPDPYDYLLIDAQCYRDYLFGHTDAIWSNLPRMAAYFKTLSGKGLDDFKHAMEDGARKQGYNDSPMNSNDYQGFAMIGQYVEVVFERFDQADEGVLGWNEARQAFPIFKNSLRDETCQQGHCLNSEGDLYAVFTFMLAYGRAPSPLEFVRWRYIHIGRHINATRGTLMQIFGALGRPSPSAGH